MKNTKRLTMFLVALLSAAPFAGAANWLTDFEKAKAEAKSRDVPILADFTGSDWCGWCIRLEREVFSKEEFKKYATDHFVLFEADFPRRKEQSDTVKAQNQKLAQQYRIQGFPTILLLDAKGTELARTGYQEGGAEAYVQHLKSLFAESKASPTSTKPAPYEYDAKNNRYWHPDHGHWHTGRPPAQTK